MAQKVEVITTSDLSGDPQAQRYTLALNGREVAIDLTAGEYEELEGTLKRYLEAGTKLSAARAGRSRKLSSGSNGTSHRLKEIRTWAQEKGYEIGDRGRIPSEIVEAYKTAHE